MKKKLIIILILFSFFTLSACGKTHSNGEIVKKLNSSINKIEKTLANIEEANENDFLSQELLDINQVQTSFFNFTQKKKDDEFVGAKVLENENDITTNEGENTQNATDAKNLNENQTKLPDQNTNVNTYFENRLPRNVNTYFLPPHMPYGYGGYGGMGYGGNGAYGAGYGGMGYGGYGAGFGGMGYGGYGAGFGGMGYDGYNEFGTTEYGGYGVQNQFQNPTANQGIYNSTNKKISNINTYGLGTNNINTYKSTQNQSTSTKRNEKNQFDKNTQINLNKLSTIYLSASHLVNVNSDVADIKDRISYILKTLKENVKNLENSDYELTLEQTESIEILLDNINSYLSKVEISKNQLKYEIDKIKEIKDDFLNNNGELSTRYVLLANFLDTRYSYYSNISNCLQEILIKINHQVDDNNTANLNDNFENLQLENKEDFTLKNNETTVENIAKQEKRTLQEELEESWKENYKIKQNNNTNENLNENKIETNINNANINVEIVNNEKEPDDFTELEPFTDGFKDISTEKKEVGTENTIFTSATLSLNEYEIEELFPSNFPFTKPKKYDYLKVLMNL